MNLQELKLRAGIQDNPDQEGLDLFAELIINEVLTDSCPCRQMGGDSMVEFQQRSADAMARYKVRK